MKKCSPVAPCVTRITPSAPMPVCRSHTAATNASCSGRASSRSTSMTKSFPVPWYFQIRIGSVTQVLRHLGHGRGTVIAGREPADPRISPEPRELPARERLRALHGPRDRLLQGQRPVQVPRELSVPDGLARSEPSVEPTTDEPLDLPQEPVVELAADAALDALGELRARDLDPGGPYALRREAIPRVREARERPAGELGHLERPDRAADVVGLDPFGRHRVDLGEATVH